MSAKRNGNKENTIIQRSRRATFTIFSLPGVLLYSVFFIYPVGLGIYYSLTDWNGITRDWNLVGFQNYITLFSNARYQKAMSFTLRYAVLLVLFTVVLSVVLALLLDRPLKGMTFYRGMFFLPAVLCGITISLVFSQIFMRVLPSLGNALNIGFLQKNLLGRKETAQYGILFVNLWQGVAMPTVLMLAGMQTVPNELYESAKLDGADGWHCFWKITMPFLLPTVTIVAILTLKSGLGVFDYIKGLTDGGPNNSTISLSLLIWQDAFNRQKFSTAVAEAVIMSLILIAFSAVQITFSNRKKVY